jgi:acid stress-induced BolA-like protein IbaG/YrbA
MLTRERLESALRAYPKGVESVNVVGEPRFVATVVSSSFESQDEAQRQADVWGYLRRQLSEHELPQIEFIFTDTPAERAAS